MPRTKEAHCYMIYDRDECLVTKDPRDGNFGDCVWCPGGPCTVGKPYRCEGIDWLKSEGFWHDGIEDCFEVDSRFLPEYKSPDFKGNLLTFKEKFYLSRLRLN